MEFIFMLTQNDKTVPNALEVYRQIRTPGLKHVGFKDVGLPPEALRDLAQAMRDDGCTVHLEVVSLDQEAELRSAEFALGSPVDYLLGGTHAQAVLPLLRGSPLRYFPFPGRIVGHPSELHGTLDEIAEHARSLGALEGVHGLDLLAYRFGGDVPALVQAVLAQTPVPVIAAGSVDRPERIEALRRAGVWGLTVGSAIFEGHFGPDPRAGVQRVLELTGHSTQVA